MTGLLSKPPRKSGEAIAYLHDSQRQGLQDFIGSVPWDHGPLLATPARQVGEDLGEPDGVIVFDPSAFLKEGTKSVGVARQWCGRYGQVDNCQVGVFMAYASRKGHALVDTRLFLPEGWATDKARREEAGVPEEVRHRTRHRLALEMLQECGEALPHSWVAGDDEMGRPSGFRGRLRVRGERYPLGVPSDTLIRDLDVPPPEYSGRGRHPKSPFPRLDRWRTGLPEGARTSIEVRDGEKSPPAIEVVRGGQASGAGRDRDRGHGPGRVAVRHTRGPI
jgi:SRSO17 transposase